MKRRYYRGNLHMHSLWSDGYQFPELAALWYRDAGYHFISFTEHDRFQTGEFWIDVGTEDGASAMLRKSGFLEQYRATFGEEAVVEKRAGGRHLVRVQPLSAYRRMLEKPGRFLIINGEEVTVQSSAGTHWINVWNHRGPIGTFRGGGGPSAAVNELVRYARTRQARSGGPIIASLNHPNYLWNMSPVDLAGATALQFFEVHTALNCTCPGGDSTHPGTERMWDLALSERLWAGQCRAQLLYGMATDDCHAYFRDCPIPGHEEGVSMPGRAWVMVEAEKLSSSAIMNALTLGRFYASSGVYLRDVTGANGRMTIRIEPKENVSYRTMFIGTRRGRTAIGEILHADCSLSPSYEFSGDELYVRATVVSNAPHPNPTSAGDVQKAWVQPVTPPVHPPEREEC